MAASDPVPTVPTPTGGLQGCAGFSWDGAAWQPAGAAYSSVATPTGVLRGVAPFSWSGSQWTPTGRSMPGVPTPTGTLDGVALYTWSGSAWTPAGGAPDVPTPSGTLQGVAAFYWDGAAWQPSGQAMPEVATPTGVLQGVAMFSWSGSAWVTASSLPATTVDLSFLSGPLDPSVTFTRASTATYYNSAGTMQTATSGTPRFEYDPVALTARGLLIEEARTNILATSTPDNTNWTVALGTLTTGAAVAPDGTSTAALLVDNATSGGHAITSVGTFSYVSGTTYTFSLYAKAGTAHGIQVYTSSAPFTTVPYANFDVSAGAVGTTGGGCTATVQNCGNGWWRCTMAIASNASASGAQFVVALNNNNNSATRPPSYAGTSTGVYLWGLQTEAGAFPTSYIATTGAAATRAADVATLASLSGRHSSAESFAGEFLVLTTQNATPRILGGSASQRAPLMFNGTRNGAEYDTVGTVTSANAFSTGSVAKLASNWTAGAANVCLNAGAVATSAALTTGFIGDTGFKLMGDSAAGDTCSGYIRRLRYWPSVLTNTQMQQVTT